MHAAITLFPHRLPPPQLVLSSKSRSLHHAASQLPTKSKHPRSPRYPAQSAWLPRTLLVSRVFSSISGLISRKPAPKGRAPTKAPTKAFQPVESQSHARGAAPNTKKGPAQSQSHARGAVSTTKNSNDSSRAKSKGGPDPTLRYKLIADIAKRDKRHDHTEYDMKTLQMIWDNKPKEDSLTKGNRYKEVRTIYLVTELH